MHGEDAGESLPHDRSKLSGSCGCILSASPIPGDLDAAGDDPGQFGELYHIEGKDGGFCLNRSYYRGHTMNSERLSNMERDLVALNNAISRMEMRNQKMGLYRTGSGENIHTRTNKSTGVDVSDIMTEATRPRGRERHL